MFVGGLVHVEVDLLKDNLGMGDARLFYPFTTAAQELGLIESLDVVLLIPFDGVVLALAWMIERKVRRVQQ